MTTMDLKPGMLLKCKDANYLVLPYGPGYIGGYSITGRIQFEREDVGKNLKDIPWYGIIAVYDKPNVGSLLGMEWFDEHLRTKLWPKP